MKHNKELTKSMTKGLMVTALFIPVIGVEYAKVLLVFPFTWLIFQGIYNLEGIDNDNN